MTLQSWEQFTGWVWDSVSRQWRRQQNGDAPQCKPPLQGNEERAISRNYKFYERFRRSAAAQWVWGCKAEAWKVYDDATKIDVFEDRVLYWYLDCARTAWNNDKNSGFLLLAIALAYFEPAQQYFLGTKTTPPGASNKYFKAALKRAVSGVQDDVCSALYQGARCGIYHSGTTVPTVVAVCKWTISIDPDRTSPISVETVDSAHRLIHIQPVYLIEACIRDLEDYCGGLRTELSSSGQRLKYFLQVWDARLEL